MTVELEKDLKQIIRVTYSNIGEKKIDWFIQLIEPFCIEEESKEIIKVIKDEKKRIDKRIEKINECWEEYIISKEQLRKAVKRIGDI